MKLPSAPWQQPKEMRRLLEVLGAGSGETRFVGGCIRDTLLGIEVQDVDLATRIAPQEVMDRLKQAGIKAIPTGLAHGTITAVVNGRPVEVTTLRRDVSTDGRRATIAYTDDWSEDAARRDFTINALSADPESGELFDYFGGLADVERRLVRFIGDPLSRIAEDHLRILRFFRFHARFGAGEPDPDGLTACTARANDLMALSRERIADELLKLLALPDPLPTVRLMVDRGILKPVLPEAAEIDQLRLLIANEQAAGVAPNSIRRLAALLPADPETAASVAARLRLSNKAAKRLVSAAVRTTGRPEQLAYWIGVSEAVDRLLIAGASLETLPALETWQRPRLPVGGGELITMGLKPGPAVAGSLQAIERQWVEQGFPADSEAVDALVRTQLAQALREQR